MFNVKEKFICIALFAMILTACINKKGNSPENKNGNPEIINCYLIKPIANDSKVAFLKDITDKSINLNNFVNQLDLGGQISVDSSVIMVTNFERQKEIFINSKCSSFLNSPDSIDLMNIYFNSGYHTKTMTRSIVEYLQSYPKNVYGFGKVTTYEYRFNGVSETEPHYLYILLREQDEKSQRLNRDLSGVAFCSDGLTWKEVNKGGQFLPIYIHLIRRGKELEIPLLYQMAGFRPIGHFVKE